LSDYEPPSRVSEPELPKIRRPVITRVFGSLLLWFFALTAILAGAGFWAYLSFTAPGPLAEKKIYEIGKGLSRADVAVVLQDQGIIGDARVFSAAAAVEGLRGAKLKAGEYEFAAGATMQDVLSAITAGRFLTYKVTIPEGWTSEMVVARLNEQPELDGTIAAPPAEGSIMPDTYVFRRHLTRAKMVEDMQAAQTKLTDDLWQARPADSVIKTKQNWITLASIVEKETGIAEERPQVASVFVNRLKQKMRLQSDPTIIYGIVGGKGKLDRPLTRADIDAATPYNTYVIDGLPPGPIANPGKAALEAVLNPDKTPYLYFVANGTGGHAFASTLEEHNANVAKWRAQQGAVEAAAPVVAAPADAAAAPAPANKPVDTLPKIPVAPVAAAAPATPVEPAQPAKPGSTVTVNGKQVPIPVLKKPKK
jgi:UPF0755 protein